MKFFHVYNEEYFEGLVKNNLINKDSGFKIQHVFSLPKEKKFNVFAAKGTKLHSLIKEGGYPFYVDRIAGGVTYHEYKFDRALIDEYTSILGDWFLGFQLHESASNRRNDWDNIVNAMEGELGPYDPKLLAERLAGTYALTPEGQLLPRFAQGTPELYAAMHFPESVSDFFVEIADMFRWYMEKTSGHILPCDSYFLFTKLQLELGMRTIMPEVGMQIPQMRIAVALARGMARQYSKTWGTYYECWRWNSEENSYSMPCYNNDPGNEWFLTQETHPDDFTSFGKNGGSSRLLQKRICYYTLMSGADYFAEEWGLNCSYSDMTTFELSDYGKVKKEFIDDALNIGKIRAHIPFAIVLPREYVVQLPMIEDVNDWGTGRTRYLKLQMNPLEKKLFGHAEDVLKFIYGTYNGNFGNEGHVITNSRFGDLFDIIYEDAPEETLKKYDALIDATVDGRFHNAKNGSFRILRTDDFEKLRHEIHELSKEKLPCVADSLHWMLSCNESGRNFVSIFNNEGNRRSTINGDNLIPDANATVTLSFKENAVPAIVKASSQNVRAEKADEHTFRVDVPAAGFVIIEY